jgi:hypothetical protein
VSDLTIERLKTLVGLAQYWIQTDADIIIAGGAPRDILHDRPVKDIDMFVMLDKEEGNLDLGPNGQHVAIENQEFPRNVRFLAKALGGTMSHHATSSDYGDIVDFCEITNLPDLPPIQIIGITERPLEDLFLYDFGLSQVAVNARGVLYTDAYMNDELNGRITYTPAIPWDQIDAHSKLRSKKRLGRLREKYSAGEYPDGIHRYGYRFTNCELLDLLPDELPPDAIITQDIT